MKKELNEIMRHSGKVWLSQALIDLAESLNPTRISDASKVTRMIKNLEGIRHYEQREADKKAEKI